MNWKQWLEFLRDLEIFLVRLTCFLILVVGLAHIIWVATH